MIVSENCVLYCAVCVDTYGYRTLVREGKETFALAVKVGVLRVKIHITSTKSIQNKDIILKLRFKISTKFKLLISKFER